MAVFFPNASCLDACVPFPYACVQLCVVLVDEGVSLVASVLFVPFQVVAVFLMVSFVVVFC